MAGTTDSIAQLHEAQRPADQGPRVSTRDEVIAVLRAEAAAIRKLGATALYLFGSAARDEMGPDSDVDVFIDYESDGSFTFVEWARLEEFLGARLGRDVDVSTRRSLHPRLKSRIEMSSIQVI